MSRQRDRESYCCSRVVVKAFICTISGLSNGRPRISERPCSSYTPRRRHYFLRKLQICHGSGVQVTDLLKIPQNRSLPRNITDLSLKIAECAYLLAEARCWGCLGQGRVSASAAGAESELASVGARRRRANPTLPQAPPAPQRARGIQSHTPAASGAVLGDVTPAADGGLSSSSLDFIARFGDFGDRSVRCAQRLRF